MPGTAAKLTHPEHLGDDASSVMTDDTEQSGGCRAQYKAHKLSGRKGARKGARGVYANEEAKRMTGDVFIQAALAKVQHSDESDLPSLPEKRSPRKQDVVSVDKAVTVTAAATIHVAPPLPMTRTPSPESHEGDDVRGPHVPSPADMNYKDVFPEHVRKTPNLYIFRIEMMQPVLQEDVDLANLALCEGDAYILLRTELVPEKQHACTHDIWTWIGGQAEIDKRFCSALFSVGLRNWLETGATISHQVGDCVDAC
jgi:hypothetical protein